MRRLMKTFDQERRDGRAEGPEKLRTDADRKRIAQTDARRAMIERLYTEAEQKIPPHKRGSPDRQFARPDTSRQVDLHNAWAAHSGLPAAQFDASSPGVKAWREAHPGKEEQAAHGAYLEEIRSSVAAAQENAAAWDSSLRDSPAEAEQAAQDWESSNGIG